MPAMPWHARPVRPRVPPFANDLVATVPNLLCGAEPAVLLHCGFASATLPVRFRTSRSPAFCWIAPAIARSGLSVPKSGWHIALTFCRSGWLVLRPQLQLAVQTTHPAAEPLADPCLTRDISRLPSGGRCHCSDRFRGFAGIPPARRPSYLSVRAFPPFLRGGLSRHD